MSSGRDAGRTQRVGSPPGRVIRVWRDLPQERRLAVVACGGLFLTLFLPWYQETVFANGVGTLRSASSSLTGWGAFSFVEAAVLLVATAVLVLLFVRAEGRAFHVPGGDGGVITAAGLWTCALIVWRIFDKQGTSRHGQIAYTSGIEWGIFVALAVAALLAYAGSLIRLSHEPEPPLPGEAAFPEPTVRRPRRGWLRRSAEQPRRRPALRAYPGPDMEADDHWTQDIRAERRPAASQRAQADPSEAPTRRVRPRSIGSQPDRPAAEPPPARPSAPLDRREIQDLDLAEPPTARLGRTRPAPPRPGPEPDPEPPTERQGRGRPDAVDDPLTLRLDRPD
jgi:hypothetical protein